MNSYMNHQQKIKQKLKKWYGNIKQDNLDARKTTLRLELKSETEKLRQRKEVEERKRVNDQFNTIQSKYIMNLGVKQR